MADRRRVLTITADTAKAGWERPDDLWRRVSLLRRIRLRRPIHFLRVLRYALGKNLRVIFDWTPDFIEVHLREEKGVAVVTNIVTAMEEMAERGSSPANIKSVIEDSDLFDKHMTGFLGR